MELPWSAERATRPPAPVPLDVFTAKTATALAEQVAISRTAWRSIAHRPCSDAAPCKHCKIVRDAHRSINDHLEQLDLARLEESL